MFLDRLFPGLLLLPMLLCVACQHHPASSDVGGGPAGSEQIVGNYEADLPAASSPGRRVFLELSSDHRARLSQDYRNGEPPIAEVGTWANTPEGRISLALSGREGGPAYPAPVRITFSLAGGNLTAVDADRDQWGSEGIQLHRSVGGPAAITSIVWQLDQIQYGDDTLVKPDDPARYTLELDADGKAAVRADCNRGHGTYVLNRSSLSLKILAYTRAACPPESLDDRFRKGLDQAASWMLRDGKLHIAMAMDSGILSFSAAPR